MEAVPNTLSNGIPADATSVQEDFDHITDNVTDATGWKEADETWTYASATTITVPTGAASKYQKGDKIKLTQTTAKYFYVTTVADTLLTVTGGTDYTVANAAITSPYYSHAENPIGFPDWFDYTSTLGGFSSTDETGIKFKVSGKQCFWIPNSTNAQLNGTSNATGFTFTLPIATPSTIINMGFVCARDNGADSSTPGYIFVTGGSANATAYKSFNSTVWTASGSKLIFVPLLSYPI